MTIVVTKTEVAINAAAVADQMLLEFPAAGRDHGRISRRISPNIMSGNTVERIVERTRAT